MKNKEEILSKISELNGIYRDMNVILAELGGKQRWSDNKFGELIELIEEPICQKLYLGDNGLYVAWGRDEINVPEKLIWDNEYLIPINNNNISPDIYGTGYTSADAILEYKMSYLEEKFNFFRQY
jgi:hypothetical protein